MMARFDINNYRDIQRVCGALAASAPKERTAWGYLHMTFSGDTCAVCGSNATQAARMRVPCQTADVPYDYLLLLPPISVTPHTKAVELYIEPDVTTVVFVDSDGDVLKSVPCPVCRDTPVDFDGLFKRMQDNFDAFGRDGSGAYQIAVDPKVLLNALNGLRPYDKVIFNFGNAVQPFRIFPYENDQQVEYMVLPMRL